MANKITNTEHYAAIANAIRRKNGETDTYTPAEMADAIGRIPQGIVLKTATATTESVTTSLAFNNLEKDPDFFAFYANDNLTRKATNVNVFIMGGVYIGSDCVRIGLRYESSTSVKCMAGEDITLSETFENGTLTLKSLNSTSVGYFPSSMTFTLYYV